MAVVPAPISPPGPALASVAADATLGDTNHGGVLETTDRHSQDVPDPGLARGTEDSDAALRGVNR